MGVSLDKVQRQAPGLLGLAKKAQVSLGKTRLGSAHTAKVGVALDFSGSMRNEYRSGGMQELTERVLALGTQFDDDGAIDLFLFDTDANYVGEVGLDNYRGAVDRLTSGRRMGTTNYAALFREVAQHYGFGSILGGGSAPAPEKRGLFGLRKAAPAPAPVPSGPADEPVYMLFLTDGAPDNRTEAANAMSAISRAPIFWQFLSIGSESIPFLEKLDDMGGRYVDNADYKPVGNLSRLSDEALFDLMLDEYPGWVEEARRRGMIR